VERLKRVLVANRGEIALRIIRACREAGVETVAVYSDADADAPHVRAADVAVHIGPAPAAESYLRVEKIVEAARTSAADAIHPGYGFLSENAALAEACESSGIVFVGPAARTIRLMGSKIEARALMTKAGVPVVPGETPQRQDDAGVLAALEGVGYPALVKASAGGGGKGMRVVRSERDAPGLIAAARREAQSAFGDGTLYVERLVERPRHVEIQLFGDVDGRVVHLLERECSVQRRHQKIVEESPSPALTPELRRAMGDAAVAAGRAVGYRSAGTVEFLLEGNGDPARFYFLEMNTRLQVEHPVTEAIAGVDLVSAQLRVAAGQPLPWKQEDIAGRGHAIECRVYAEDPAQDFLPQAGRLLVYREPSGPGIRVDSGVVEASEVPVQYDPLIAKLVAHAETRAGALARAQAALRTFVVLGVKTNIPFLLRVLADAEFAAGRMHTGSIDERLAELLPSEPEPPAHVVAAARQWRPRADSGGAQSGSASAGRDPWDTLRGGA
jgi:acetyl-CoA carboxylase biotin carboxylase subunit